MELAYLKNGGLSAGLSFHLKNAVYLKLPLFQKLPYDLIW
jgi:hypothetical protein